MSLKDFHGGSIPSSLKLPSAPEVIVRSNSGRQISSTWGNIIGRSDYQSRTKSSGVSRYFDDKGSFISHPARIGQNFDEDERGSLNGISDSSRSMPPIRRELNSDYASSVKHSDSRVTNVVRYTGGILVGGDSQIPSGSNDQNAWGMRKEVTGGESGAFSLFRSVRVTKFAKASAVEKSSSGPWESKSPLHLLPHLLYSNDNGKSSGVGLFSERANYDTTSSIPPTCQELNSDYASSVRHSDSQFTNVVSQVGLLPLVRGNSQIPSGNNGQGGSSSSHPNSWGMKKYSKEVMGVGESGSSSKFAKASAVKKLSSGERQSESPLHLLPHLLYSSGVGLFSERGNYDVAQEIHDEWGWNSEVSVQGGESGASSKFAKASAVEKLSSGERQSESPLHLLPPLLYSSDVGLFSERGNYDATQEIHDEWGRNSEVSVQGGDRELPGNERVKTHSFGQDEAKIGASQSQHMVHSELSERPKLKLLPRTKMLGTLEKDYEQPSNCGKLEAVSDTYANANTLKQGFTIGESGNRPAERPKLNLKPRSQALEKSGGTIERDRSALFGGARPRELVLKERGGHEITLNKLDLSQTPNRNSQNGNSKGSRDMVKPQQNWQPEPNTWRKPIVQPKLVSQISYGKMASALDLAQSFCRSISNPKETHQFSELKGLYGRNQMPFSRLMDKK